MKMNKIYATCIIGAVAWCAAAQSCSLPLDGSPANCPEDFPTLKREEMKGDIDIWNPHHFIQMEQMFIRNARRTQM